MGGGRLRPRPNILQPHPPPGAHPNTSIEKNEDTHHDDECSVGARVWAVGDDEGAHGRGGNPANEEDDRDFTEQRRDLFVRGGYEGGLRRC